MNKYNFDEIIDRKNTNSLKWDYAKRRGKPADVIPLWVADMDFKAPKEVIDALIAKASHGIFGYSEPMDDYFDALSSWIKKHHHWEPENRKFVLTYGVVGGICTLINILTNEGDGILINQPVYYPFMESIIDNKRKLINSNLVYKNNK
ncbi:MAG: aminotransferase, partial [Acholeplasmatales bacterium]|nr:aminotransferase [Acholeplasmatales bacterium]